MMTKGTTMTIPDFEKLKQAERHARVNDPLMELFYERWHSTSSEYEASKEAARRVQAVSQELLDLITAGLL